MKVIVLLGSLLLLVVFFTGPVAGQNLVIYPAKGQSQQKMDKDKAECYSWAKQQTGISSLC